MRKRKQKSATDTDNDNDFEAAISTHLFLKFLNNKLGN